VRWGWDRKPVLSDQDGNFELGEGQYIVRAYREGGGEGLLEHVAAGSTGVLLTIGDTGQIAGPGSRSEIASSRSMVARSKASTSTAIGR
jgi:hypothetical protein